MKTIAIHVLVATAGVLIGMAVFNKFGLGAKFAGQG